MPRRISIIKSLIKSAVDDVKKDFGSNIVYKPYEPKVLGNKLSSHNRDYK